MKYLAVVVILAGLTGCGFKEKRRQRQEDAWLTALAIETLGATSRMYQCTSEIYAIGHGGGPICKTACAQYLSLNDQYQHPPSFVRDFHQDGPGMPKDEVCNGRTKRK